MSHQQVISEIQSKSLSVAVKQALRYELNCTFSQIVGLTGVAMKNVCSHVYAKRGSNVARWEDRKPEQKSEAVRLANLLLKSEF